MEENYFQICNSGAFASQMVEESEEI